MPIPFSQLDTWSHQGAITTSSAAYNSIRHALLKSGSPLSSRGVEVFLQGSYANSTNIYGDSDVDVVVYYENTFFKDMSALTLAQQQLHQSLFPPATYRWAQLRDEALAALYSHFGNGAVTLGNKAINVNTGTGRLTADVVPAVQFRRYATFTDRNNLTAYFGIQFFDSAGNAVVNYPKLHIERGEAKNRPEHTSGQYKKTIRIFKNFRNYLIENDLLGEDIAPSYFLECALYNVPDEHFTGDITSVVPAILNYLQETPCAGFLCQNGVVQLIGNSSTQWPEANCEAFVAAAIGAWNSW